MRVTIVGGGTVGRVLGVRLSATGADVSFVTRTPLPDRLTIERVEDAERQELCDVRQSRALLRGADCVLACLPFDALDDSTIVSLASADAPVVLAVPLLPLAWARLQGALGDRAVAAVVGVTGYVREDDVARYWLPRAVRTSVQANRGAEALVRALDVARVPSELAHDVARTSQTVTASLLPLAMILAARRTIHGALEDDALLALMLEAMRETGALARELGEPPAWLGMLTRFVGARMLKVGVGIAERTSREALHYVEAHFGGRTASARALAEDALASCAARRLPATALAALATRLS